MPEKPEQHEELRWRPLCVMDGDLMMYLRAARSVLRYCKLDSCVFDCRDVIKICGQLWSEEQPYMKFSASFPQIYRFQQAKLIHKLRIRIDLACWNWKIYEKIAHKFHVKLCLCFLSLKLPWICNCNIAYSTRTARSVLQYFNSTLSTKVPIQLGLSHNQSPLPGMPWHILSWHVGKSGETFICLSVHLCLPVIYVIFSAVLIMNTFIWLLLYANVNDISVLFVEAHRCKGDFKNFKKVLPTVGLPRHRRLVGFFLIHADSKLLFC